MVDVVSVKIQGDGYLLNGELSVPNDAGNRHYQAIQEWIGMGNTPDPEFSPAELLANAKAVKWDEIKAEFLSRSQADGININLDTAQSMGLVVSQLSPSTTESARFWANVTAAAVAIVFVDALGDVPSVEAYDAVTDPSWSP